MNKELLETPFYGNALIDREADNSTIVVTRLKTPFGELLAGATTKGICLLEFLDTDRIEMQVPRLEKIYASAVVGGTSPFFSQLNQQLQHYFSNKTKKITVPLDARGTEFQKKVWHALQSIPFGETRSYQQQAVAIHNPKAIRAVANANRNNRISIIIPCHRVIGKNGTMTGYGGGIWRKEFLLALESKPVG